MFTRHNKKHYPRIITKYFSLTSPLAITGKSEIKKYEPADDKTYSKKCATNKDSDQPAYLHTALSLLISMCLLQPPGYRGMNDNTCYTG